MVARSRPSATPGAGDDANPFADSSDIFGAFAGSGAGAKPIDVEFRRIEAPCPEPPAAAKPFEQLSEQEAYEWYERQRERYDVAVWGIDDFLRAHGYLRVPYTVARDCKGAAVTFGALLEYANKKGECRPHVATIAKRAGFVRRDDSGNITDDGTRTVKNHIATLRKRRAIDVHRPAKYCGNQYRLNPAIEIRPYGKLPRCVAWGGQFKPAYAITMSAVFNHLHMVELADSDRPGDSDAWRLDGRNELSVMDVSRATGVHRESVSAAFRDMNRRWFRILPQPWDRFGRYEITPGPLLLSRLYGMHERPHEGQS